MVWARTHTLSQVEFFGSGLNSNMLSLKPVILLVCLIKSAVRDGETHHGYHVDPNEPLVASLPLRLFGFHEKCY